MQTQRLRSARTSTQSDQHLCCSLLRQYSSIQNFKTPASFCSWAGRFESYKVANPEGRFSRDEAHITVDYFFHHAYFMTLQSPILRAYLTATSPLSHWTLTVSPLSLVTPRIVPVLDVDWWTHLPPTLKPPSTPPSSARHGQTCKSMY